jgi:eukaryotic-like serine/threonine-protein kinase
MGAVYEVTDERTDSRRALKVMLPEILEDVTLRARFAQEARITGAIESDHIVHISDAGVDPETDTPFLVMDLLRGEDLGSIVDRRSALPRREVLTYLAQAALGLDKTHAAGIVHRDLKPENLFITRRDDGTPCLKILDFGIAKVAIESSRLLTTRVMGTPLYMSPEQIDGKPEIGYRADLYALGQIAYTLLVGEPYWKDEREGSHALARFFTKVRQGVKEPPSARAWRRGVSLPAAFDGWFLKATALLPEDRFDRAAEVVTALSAALGDATFESTPRATDSALPLSEAPSLALLSAGRDRLGPYRLVQELGHGGFARTWLAEEMYDGKKLRDVALKLFLLPSHVAPASPEAARWYDEILDEARALCRVEHPNVVRFYALHQDRGRGLIALAMEYVPGKSLDVLLREVGRLDERTVLEIGIAVAWALAAVHNAGLVHRDVKPGNVIQSASGYKLIDFGIAASVSSPASPAPRPTTQRLATVGTAPGASTDPGHSLATAETIALASATNTADAAPSAAASDAPSNTRPVWDPASISVGTPGYIAPECVELGAEPSPTTDLYALGVTLFKLMTGSSSSSSCGTARVSAPALPVPAPRLTELTRSQSTAPLSLAEITALLLEADPSARPRHADWVARELERARAQTSPSPRERESPSEGQSPPSLSSPLLLSGRASRGVRSAEAGEAQQPPALCSHPLLVGRDAPLGALFRAAREAKQGGVRIALITGPQGIGRSRLLDAAIDQAGFDPSRVILGHASPERRSPLRPLIRAIEGRPGALPIVRKALDRALAPTAPPSSRDGPNDALEAVEEALLWASVDAPLLLALDDLQWGDAHTLDLLRMLIDRADASVGFHLFVIAAVRNEPNPSAALRALLGAARSRVHTGVKLIPLGPLTAGDTALLAQAVSPIAPPLERAVVRGSGGVPFFVVHALLVFRENGAIAWHHGAWHPVDPRVLSDDVPGVADLVEARIASYFDPASAKVALRALAAIALYGGGLGIETILRVVGGDPASVESALEVLVDAEFVAVSGERQEYSFAQEMVRQAVLNLVRQRPWFYRLHRALLDALAEGASGASDAVFLANGYEKLGARERSREWFERAMRASFEAGLFTDAAELGDRLAALIEGPEARAGAELDVVRALLRGRKFEDVKLRLDRPGAWAAGAGAAPRASFLRRRIYRLEAAYGLRETGVSDPSIVADADATGDLNLRCEARMALAGVSPEGPAMQLLAEAVALSALGGPALEHAARAFRLELNHAASRFDRELAEEDLTRGLELALATGSTWQSIIIEGDLAILEADLGRIDDAIARLRRLCELTEAIGMRWQTPIFSQNLSALLLRAGRDREAAEAAARTAELAVAAGDPVFRATALSLRADALRRVGDLVGALSSIDEAEELQRLRGGRSRALTLLRRAMIRAALGRGEEALEDARQAREVAERYADQNVAIGANVLEKLRLAQRGEATRTELEQAVAEASEARIRMLTREIVAEARAFLSSDIEPTPP